MGSLEKNFIITANEFNNLKDEIDNIVTNRTSTSTNYNKDGFQSNLNIETQSINNTITKTYFQKILDFFKNFYYEEATEETEPVKYPTNLNNSYKDDIVNIGDIIYALNTLLNFLQELAQQNRINNQDCRGDSCMGLCTDNCNRYCYFTCSFDGCFGDCGDGCQGGCGTSCRHDSNCWQTCGSDGCTGNCTSTCGRDGCSGSCSRDGCSASCTRDNCSNQCEAACDIIVTGGITN